MPDTLAQRVRAAHPGAYDDLTDTQLETAVTAKYPGVYDDLPRTTAAPPAETRTTAQRVADTVADVGIGAAKGAAHTVSALGDLARKVPGVAALDRLMTPIPVNTTPANTAQRVGYGAEQVGEFFVPGMGTGSKAAQAAKAGGLSYAQSGSPAAAGVSAALTAVLPGASALQRASGALQKSAEKSTAQALGATKEAMKAQASRLAPEMLARGVKGTRAAMLAQARSQSATVGAQLDDAYRAAAAAGTTVPSAIIRDHLTSAAQALTVPDAAGVARAIPGTERVVRRLGQLERFVAGLGDDIPVDKAATIKRTWDHIVSKAGLFGPKATASATDASDAWAVREASGAFRDLLNANPTIGALNQEVAFWTGLKKVLAETERRTQAQSGGLVSGITGSVGAGAGFASGDSMSERMSNAVVGGLAGRQLVRALSSPWFRTTAAGPAKQALANALASGETGRVILATEKMLRAAPSLVAQGQAQ